VIPLKTVKGPRADLTSVRGAGDVRRLHVRGPGIESLAGIERFGDLVGLTLEKVEAPDLGRLRPLPGLRELVLDEVTGPLDLAAIADLPDLQALEVFVRDRSAAEAVGQLDLGGLLKLDAVFLHYLGPRPFVPVRVDWPERALALGNLRWSGFVFGDADTERVCALAGRLRQFAFTPQSAQQKARIMEAFPRGVAIAEDANVDALREIREIGPGEWQIGRLLADEWETETTGDAVEWLERELERRDPELATRVRVEEDADLVFVTSADRGDLETVERIVSEMSPPPADLALD
jgi:hypothetical protein